MTLTVANSRSPQRIAPPSLTERFSALDAAQVLGKLVSPLIPAKYGDTVAEVLSHIRQPLGQAALPVSEKEGAAFLVKMLTICAARKAQERIIAATGGQRSDYIQEVDAALEELKNVKPEDLRSWASNPPALVNKFVKAYMNLGHKTPQEINRAIQPANSIQEAVTRATGVAPIAGNDVKLLVNGKEAYDAIESVVGAAQHSIHTITYTWHEDETGKKMADLYIRKKK